MKEVKHGFAAAGCLLAVLLLQGCGGGDASSPPPAERVVAPPDPSETWALAAPADVGMDGAVLNQAVSSLPAGDVHLLSSMIIMRHGKPVLEQYWGGYNKDTLHDMRSATKSITSLMTGIAIDKGMLSGVDEPIRKHLGAAYPAAPGLGHGIALKHLLTMSSGLACNDRSMSSPGNEELMYKQTDWVSHFVNLPVIALPAEATHYCTGGVVALGRIVAEASKLKIPDFSARHLFNPIGINSVRWAAFDNQQQTDTGGHLSMRPRDMAKIGQLVLQGGKWNGVQVVSPAWITQSTSMHTMMDRTERYGYLWWLRTFTIGSKSYLAHYASGNGGQYIIVIPELDMVAAFTGENYNSVASRRPFDILQSYVLPSVR